MKLFIFLSEAFTFLNLCHRAMFLMCERKLKNMNKMPRKARIVDMASFSMNGREDFTRIRKAGKIVTAAKPTCLAVRPKISFSSYCNLCGISYAIISPHLAGG